MRNIIYLPDSTWTDLDKEPIFQKFMKEYLDLLQTNLQKVKVKGDSYTTCHYICGQAHIPQNPFWQPFSYIAHCVSQFKTEHHCHK